MLQVFATGPSVPAAVLTVKGAATALFSPDSGRLYVAGQNEVAAYACEGWKRLWTRPLQQFAPQQIVLSPDGRHLAVLARDEPAWSTSISVVDSADGTLRARLEAAAATAWRGDRRVLDRVAFSSDSSMIAFLADQGVVSIARLADLQTYMRLDHPGNLNDVQAIAFSRDNRYLMTISGSYASLGFPGAGAYTDQSVLTWDLSSGRIVERFPAGVDVSGDFTEAIRQNDKLYLSQPVLTPEGSHVAAAVFPNFRVYMSVAARRAPADLYVWRMQRGATDVALHVTDVTDESFIASSRDGRVFLTRGSDFEATKESTLRVWRLDADHLLRAACGRLARNLSTTEWRELIGADRPYRRTCPDLLPVPASPQRRPVSQ
jgi:WD40 repeat protein